MHREVVISTRAGERITLPVLVADTIASRARGLMFRAPHTAPSILFLLPTTERYALHALFCFFPFGILFLRQNTIVEKRLAKPFELLIVPQEPCDAIIEIPLTQEISKNIYNKAALGDHVAWRL